MATILNADTVVGGAVVTGDASGVLALQAAGSTQVTINGSGVVLANPLPVASGGTGATSLSGITTGTATNLAGGSNGTIPYQSAAGTTQMLAVGSAGQVLQTNGAGAPTWVTPGGGSLIFLSTVTASNSATVNIETTFDSTYDNYFLIISNLRPVTVGTELRIRFKLSGTYVTSDYNFHSSSLNSGSTAYAATCGNPQTYLLASSAVSSDPSYSNQGYFYIQSPSSTTLIKTTYGTFVNGLDNNTVVKTTNLYGSNSLETGALTGLRFFMSSGNISTGTFRLYGIKNS